MTSRPREISEKKWNYIHALFLRYAFNEEEARWAADNNIDPRDAARERSVQIKRVLRNRKEKIDVLAEASDKTRREVIEFVARRRRDFALARGEDEWNVFIEESP